MCSHSARRRSSPFRARTHRDPSRRKHWSANTRPCRNGSNPRHWRPEDTRMDWQTLARELFGESHRIRQDGDLLSGEAVIEAKTLGVVGTTNHAPIGVALALAQARVVL